MQDQTRPPQTDPDQPGAAGGDGPRQQRLREIAHRIWEAEGRPDGRADVHWRAAEAELAAEDAARGRVATAEGGRGPEEDGPAPGIRARHAMAKAKTAAAAAAARLPEGRDAAPGAAPRRATRSRTRRPSEDA